jgi:transposase
VKCKRESDGRKLDHKSLQVLRQQAVKAVRQGQTVQRVASALGLNIRTVFRWLSAFASGGQNALLAKPIPGRPPLFAAEELRWLARAVREHPPQQFRFEFAARGPCRSSANSSSGSSTSAFRTPPSGG